MFGLSLPCQLIQGPAVRTWNCVAHFANLLWCKFNYVKNPIMPRSRRRHHSRSRTRSRSRSHSIDRDRDTKRRKIENYDSPQHKRSDSPDDDQQSKIIDNGTTEAQLDSTLDTEDQVNSAGGTSEDVKESPKKPTSKASTSTTTPKALKTPQKSLTPKQLKKKLESEEKRKERERLKEEKLKLLNEKKKIKKEEYEKRVKEKQEKLEQKQKEIEERQKIRDLKEEKKKKEREDRELKRKEKEEMEEQKRKEQDEKSKEKQKIEQKKQKAATAFVSFFKKKNDSDEKKSEKPVTLTFMPFEIKSDMRLAPLTRVTLDIAQKQYVVEILKTQRGPSYLEELKSGKKIGKGFRTWPYSDNQNDEVIIVEGIPGESIEEQSKIPLKQRAKFFKFDENRRPAYFGTWRKKSAVIKARKPFAIDNAHFDYDADSDEEWEEEDSGESLRGSDDDKENDSENEYEEDNEFFVPHGHLSDDEVNDEENSVISPEAHKAKLKLLKKKFEEEMQSKTERIKPRLIGCIWYNKDGSNVDAAIDEFLKPLSIISKGPIVIKKRSKYIVNNTPFRRSFLRGKELSAEYIPNFLKWVHGSSKNSKSLVQDFLNFLEEQDLKVEVSRNSLIKQLKKLAVWTRSPEGGPVLKKYCWFVHKNISDEYKVDLPTPN